jgi:hypothetical protein
MNRLSCLALTVGLVATAAGCTDFKPHIPQAQVEQLLSTWLREAGLPDPNRGFDPGQQAAAVITKTYGYGYAPTESYAELRLTDFRYRDEGEPKVYTGRAVLSLMQSPQGAWFIHRLAFLSEQGAVGREFFPTRTPEKKS